jgi:hypothetical protein
VVFTDKPVILQVKMPVPEPHSVLLLAIVGFDAVLQHTPLTVTRHPPSLVMFPPLVAVVEDVAEVVPVVNVGGKAPENVTSFP